MKNLKTLLEPYSWLLPFFTFLGFSLTFVYYSFLSKFTGISIISELTVNDFILFPLKYFMEVFPLVLLMWLLVPILIYHKMTDLRIKILSTDYTFYIKRRIIEIKRIKKGKICLISISIIVLIVVSLLFEIFLFKYPDNIALNQNATDSLIKMIGLNGIIIVLFLSLFIAKLLKVNNKLHIKLIIFFVILPIYVTIFSAFKQSRIINYTIQRSFSSFKLSDNTVLKGKLLLELENTVIIKDSLNEFIYLKSNSIVSKKTLQ